MNSLVDYIYLLKFTFLFKNTCYIQPTCKKLAQFTSVAQGAEQLYTAVKPSLCAPPVRWPSPLWLCWLPLLATAGPHTLLPHMILHLSSLLHKWEHRVWSIWIWLLLSFSKVWDSSMRCHDQECIHNHYNSHIPHNPLSKMQHSNKRILNNFY